PSYSNVVKTLERCSTSVRVCGLMRAEKQEEVGADLNRSASCFRIIHGPGGGDAAAAISRRPVALAQDEHRPHFPPDRLSVDAGIVYNMAVIRGGDEDRRFRRPGNLS